EDKFADVAWTPSRTTRSPVLDATVGHVDCTVEVIHEAGDHYLVIGRVVDMAVGAAEEPLLYYRGAYRT
ncbi:MAG: flavin reductase domain protein FMN-binding protein, partial [Nocardioides sp.]|uniref:flavin reductase family protein n=1 Tax=Nocardioides sp. TaxID=35761 RepID=UPI002617C969